MLPKSLVYSHTLNPKHNSDFS